jgi:hypothetical protein
MINRYASNSLTARIKGRNDYTTFGSIMEGRSYEGDTSLGYRFGFNTQEKDDEVYGKGNATTAEFWEYDARLGRRWNTDPIVKPWESPFACFYNSSIYFNDPFGLDPSEKRWWKNAINYTWNFLKRDSYKNKANKEARKLEKQGYENVNIKYKLDEEDRKYADVTGTKKTSESTPGNAGETTFTSKTFKRETESWMQRNFAEGYYKPFGSGAGGESRPNFKKVGVPIMFGTAATLATGGSALVSGASGFTLLGMTLGVNEMGTNSKGETLAQSFAQTKDQKMLVRDIEIMASIICITESAMNVRKLVLNPPSGLTIENLKAGLILNSSSSTIGMYDLSNTIGLYDK